MASPRLKSPRSSKTPPRLLRTACPTSTADPFASPGGSAVAPPTDDGGIWWRLEYPFVVALDGHDVGVHTDSRDAQHIGALEATTLFRCRLVGQLVHVR